MIIYMTVDIPLNKQFIQYLLKYIGLCGSNDFDEICYDGVFASKQYLACSYLDK